MRVQILSCEAGYLSDQTDAGFTRFMRPAMTHRPIPAALSAAFPLLRAARGGPSVGCL
jgi:hypothetical protein